jgi:hypothetical protein
MIIHQGIIQQQKQIILMQNTNITILIIIKAVK